MLDSTIKSFLQKNAESIIDKAINNKVVKVVVFNDTGWNQVVLEAYKFGFREEEHEGHI